MRRKRFRIGVGIPQGNDHLHDIMEWARADLQLESSNLLAIPKIEFNDFFGFSEKPRPDTENSAKTRKHAIKPSPYDFARNRAGIPKV
jgi:hypothetical protein